MQDTHITHELLLVLRHSIISCLLEPYVCHQSSTCDVVNCDLNMPPSYEGFEKFVASHVKDPCYLMMFELSKLMLGIHILLLGIRRYG